MFDGFDPEQVAGRDVAPLLSDARLIRSGPKLRACVRNAEATLALRDVGGLPAMVREHAELPSPVRERWGGIPGSTESSSRLAKRLKGAGFVFVGPTTAYSMLQACGLVNDHVLACDARDRAEQERQDALGQTS